VAVAGTYYLHTLAWSWDPVIAGLAPGLIAVALLTVNNLRDIDEDRAAGRKTLPVRFGRTFARVEYAACLVIGCVAVPLYFYATTGFRWFAAAPLSLAVVGPGVRSLLAVSEARALNHLLARTGGLLLIFSLVFAIGWILR
jgi:1,4-dihydroxy-2-naphthoate octaprenyltransferase